MPDARTDWKRRQAPAQPQRCGQAVKTVFVPYASSNSGVAAAAPITLPAAPWDREQREAEHG